MPLKQKKQTILNKKKKHDKKSQLEEGGLVAYLKNGFTKREGYQFGANEDKSIC